MISLGRHRFLGVLLIAACGAMVPTQPALAQDELGAFQPAAAELGVGDVNADVVFTPVTPCRLIDTRVVGPAFSANEVRHYKLIGPTSYASIGGNPSGCNIPGSTTPVTATTYGNTVRALVLSFTATDVGGNGNLRAWPTNQTMPLAAVLTYAPAMYAVANGVAVVTCDAAVAAGTVCVSGDLSIRADSASANLVVDVLGYYTPQRYFLASNRTLLGVFAIDYPATATGQSALDGVSFHPPLQTPPTPNFVAVGGVPTTNCPGTGANPLAAPGHLCLYATTEANVLQRTILKQLGGWVFNMADPIGFTYYVEAAVPGRVYSVGVWAVTAP